MLRGRVPSVCVVGGGELGGCHVVLGRGREKCRLYIYWQAGVFQLKGFLVTFNTIPYTLVRSRVHRPVFNKSRV